jgi:hypothetical protein
VGGARLLLRCPALRVRLIPRDAHYLAELQATVPDLPGDLIVDVQPDGQWGEMEADISVVGGILRDGVAWKRCPT